MDPMSGTQTTSSPAPNAPTRSGRNVAAGVLLLIGGILSFVSGFVAWWTLSESGGTISFLPGQNASFSGFGQTMTESYASFGLGQVGGLYLAILALAIVVGILAIVGGLLGLVGGMGRLPSRRQGMVRGLAIAALVLAIVAVAAAPAVQPWAIHTASSGANCSGFNSSSPCSSFWGSESGGTSWGASTGWYLMIGTLVLSLVGLILWRSMRPAMMPTQPPMAAPASPPSSP
jgi:hypothetical protein